jgi:hypothetical protein
VNLEQLLRERIAECHRKIGGHRAAIASEEAACKRWEDALAEEIKLQGGDPDAPTLPPRMLTLAEAKSKEAVLVSTLRQAENGLTSAQLTKLVHPAVSRSFVFVLLKRMSKQGAIVRDEKSGVYRFREEEAAPKETS